MIINDLFTNKKTKVSEGMAGKVVFSGTGADGGTYEIIQSSPTDFMIHANGKHIDTYGSLQRAMSVLKNEVQGLQQGVAEVPLNELAPSSGEGGNGPFDYGSAIIEIGQNFVDNYADSAAGEDAADIIQVGKTFMSAGMTKGISALFALDTQVYDHVLDELSSLGFNVDLDIVSKRRAPTLDRDAQNAMRAVQAKFDTQPGQVYLVTGHHEFGSSSGKIKATSPEAAKQKFIANAGMKFNKVDVASEQGMAEGEVVPFKRPQSPTAVSWQKLPKDVLTLANDWFWADYEGSGLDATMDPKGLGSGYANQQKYLGAQLQQRGWAIDIDDEFENVVLKNKQGQTILLPIEDAQTFSGWSKGTNPVTEQDVAEGGDVFKANIKNTPEYKAGLATGKLPVPHPEGTQEYANYYKGVIDKASPTLSKVGEDDANFGKSAALMTPSPQAAQKAKDIVQQRADANVISQAKMLGAIPQQEGEQQPGADYRDPREVDYDDEYDAMVARVKKLAGLGPLKTVYDPNKRVYRNMPTAVQPKK